MGNKNEVKILATPIIKNCQTCAFWRQDNEQCPCGLGSVTCINAIVNHKPPTRWMSVEDIKPLRQPMVTADTIPKGRELFMNSEEYTGAKENKDRNVVMYPDMRELTDESKAQLRKDRADDRRKMKEAK